MSSNTPSIQLDTRVLEKLYREAPGKAKRVVKKIAFDVQAYAVQHMSTSSPSAPGEPPGVDTGLLKNSIHVEEVGEMSAAVVAGTDYAILLEYGTATMEPRPFMGPAVEAVGDTLPEQLKAVVTP